MRARYKKIYGEKRMETKKIHIAVLADIHSNFEAFRTCIKEAEKRNICDYIFLGDYLGDLACPQKTLGLMAELKNKYRCVFIRGNKEEYWINHRKNKEEKWESGKSGSGMLCYNYENLKDKDIDFFEKLPISQQINMEGCPEFTVCHGSPFKVNQSMRYDFDYIDDLTKRLPSDLTVCGHFHIAADYIKNGKRVINPGSVGVALRTGGGKAQFMILHGDKESWEPEFLSLDYNVEKAIEDMDKENLYLKAPCWYKITKNVLKEGGNDSYVTVLTKAHELYFKETGNDVWMNIPEEYWEKSLWEIMGI